MVIVLQYLKGALAHVFMLIVNFCVLVGIIMSVQILGCAGVRVTQEEMANRPHNLLL